jgi:hypothetical protein
MKTSLQRTFIFCLLTCIASYAFLSSFPVFARDENGRSEAADCSQKVGYRLVHGFWKSVMEQDVRRYSRELDCSFQGLNLDGIYNRDDQIEGLSSLTVTSFELHNLCTACHGKTLVVSYDFYATGEDIVSGPSIDVWQKTCAGWKQISHSYVPFVD